MASGQQPLHVAIIGGGLCGISLGIALRLRNIPFTLYESRGSFTEIGAGINWGPSALRSLRIIDPSLGEKVYKLATRNAPPNEDVWMLLRYGAPSGDHEDGELMQEIRAPPTGSMTLHRQELLQALAEQMGQEYASFNKKLVGYSNLANEAGVKMQFADGTEETASILVGCDGIHSAVRTVMCGKDSPTSRPVYDEKGAYRAVIPMETAVAAVGESVRSIGLYLGPNGYLINYPVNGGKAVNCGFWVYRKGTWDRPEWVAQDQKENLWKDAQGWGERVRKILALFPENPAYWGAFQHIHQPDRFTDGRVILIGDGAHSMPPHQGSGAATAVEDACVLAEVLSLLDKQAPTTKSIEAALQAVEKLRRPRSERIHKYSSEAGPRWFDFYNQKLEGAELDEFNRVSKERLEWIFAIDMEAHVEEAKEAFRETMRAAPILNGDVH